MAQNTLILKVPCVQLGRLQRRYKRFLADVVFDDVAQPLALLPLASAPPAAAAAAAAAAAVAAASVPALAMPAAASANLAAGAVAAAAAVANLSAGARTRGSTRKRKAAGATAAASHADETPTTDEAPVGIAAATIAATAATVATTATATAVSFTTVHCPNTGPMTGLLDVTPQPRVICTAAPAGAVRKYGHTLTAIQPEPGGAWVGVHSALANKLVGAMLAQGLLVPVLGPHSVVQQEVAYGEQGQSRVDFLLTRPPLHSDTAVATAAAAAVVPTSAVAGPMTNMFATATVSSQPVLAPVAAEGPPAGADQAAEQGSRGRGKRAGRAASGTAPQVGSQQAQVEGEQAHVGSQRAQGGSQRARSTSARGAVEVKVSTKRQGSGVAKGPAAASSSAPTTTMKKVYVEVKSVTLTDPVAGGPHSGRAALFPDTVSERAQKHTRELMSVAAAGHEAVLLFVVQRGDCSSFSPCEAADPRYAALVRQAAAAGVAVVAVGVELELIPSTAQGGGMDLAFNFLGQLPVKL